MIYNKLILQEINISIITPSLTLECTYYILFIYIFLKPLLFYFQVTLLDAIGRELLDEKGPKVKWDVNPHNRGIECRAVDRLFIETHPEYAPVPVPYKYYQVILFFNCTQ